MPAEVGAVMAATAAVAAADHPGAVVVVAMAAAAAVAAAEHLGAVVVVVVDGGGDDVAVERNCVAARAACSGESAARQVVRGGGVERQTVFRAQTEGETRRNLNI